MSTAYCKILGNAGSGRSIKDNDKRYLEMEGRELLICSERFYDPILLESLHHLGLLLYWRISLTSRVMLRPGIVAMVKRSVSVGWSDLCHSTGIAVLGAKTYWDEFYDMEQTWRDSGRRHPVRWSRLTHDSSVTWTAFYRYILTMEFFMSHRVRRKRRRGLLQYKRFKSSVKITLERVRLLIRPEPLTTVYLMLHVIVIILWSQVIIEVNHPIWRDHWFLTVKIKYLSYFLLSNIRYHDFDLSK